MIFVVYLTFLTCSEYLAKLDCFDSVLTIASSDRLAKLLALRMWCELAVCHSLLLKARLFEASEEPLTAVVSWLLLCLDCSAWSQLYRSVLDPSC